MIEVGTFECKSGILTPTDPCYLDKTDLLSGNFNAKKGKWKAYIVQEENYGLCNSEILILHESYQLPDILQMKWAEGPSVGVDSGQAGFFDADKKDNKGRAFFPNFEKFYDNCCHITLHGYNAGTLDCGAVTSSGGGDGGYECFVGSLENQTEFTAARIHFTAARIHFFRSESAFMDLIRLQETKQKDLPLLVGQMNTPAGKQELEKRLKK